jgi:hypothetical protein
MASYTVTGNDNMSALDLSTIENGTITTNNSTTLTITATDGTVYTLTGNFTGGGGATFPTGGTITGWTSSATDGSTVDIASLNLAVKAFDHDLQDNSTSNLLHAMFSGDDHFDATAGTGGDILSGYGANDTFDFGSTFGGTDAANGGGGNNTVVLNGDYSNGLTIGAGALTDIQELQLFGDDTYDVTLAAGAVSGVRQMIVDVDRPGAGDALNFNASAEDTGFYFKLGGITDSTVTGGAGNNVFYGAGSGDNTLVGGAGNDKFIFGAGFNGTDSINGGGGTNSVILNGNHTSDVTLGANSLVNIQHLVLEGDAGANNYDLTLNAANDSGSNSLAVVAHDTDSSDDLTVNGSAATGKLVFDGGAATDNFTGGSGVNIFNTGSGVETLTGGGSHDHFIFSSVANSTGPTFDTIDRFNALNDHFVLGTQITGIDPAVTTGSLSASTFNADLTADLGPSQLAADHAVLFTANAGTYAGDTFLVIDMNGQAGYQAGQDIVIELNNATHLSSLSAGNFYTHAFA